MLIQFTVRNYKSIKDEAVISFEARRDKSLEDSLIYAGKKDMLVPAIAIFGANAAGKSNILQAIRAMWEMVAGDTAKAIKGQSLPWTPFAGNEEPTFFETVFIYDNIKYMYGFSFDDKRIHSEYLYYWAKNQKILIFSREFCSYKFCENINEQVTLKNRTPENKLYLVSSNYWNLPQTESAYKWFREKLLFSPCKDTITAETLTEIIRNDKKKSRVLKELMIADLGITDITIGNAPNGTSTIITEHCITQETGSKEYFWLPLNCESSGTQQYFTKIVKWLQVIEKGSILIADEIDSSLHPFLTRRLIEMIQDGEINTNNAQLLFTTHDTLLLDLTLLRRDQIWFAERNKKTCATELFSLSSFSPRKEENIRKEYLQGRFGAIPFIEDNN